MCGIFAILNSNSIRSNENIINSFNKGKHRGPEFSVYKNVMLSADFGFHRLAINGLNAESNQPIVYKDVVLICNGEIYNYKQLYKHMKVTPTTDSDCEVIIHLYLKYGMKQTLQMLDGVFAFCLLDYRIISDTSTMFFARDPYGIRPMYVLKPSSYGLELNKDNSIVLASELKMLNDIYQDSCKPPNKKDIFVINQVPPGTYSQVEMLHKVSPSWKIKKINIHYHNPGFSSCAKLPESLSTTFQNIQYYLKTAVEKRCDTTDRPIACLLSGGLDSSLITSLVNDYCIKNKLPPLETYSIGIKGSEDLKHAITVSNYLNTKHTQIELTEQDFIDAIPHVIYDIESYDTTTVRASIGNWLIGKYISEHSEAKVIFNGDGSDELTGGYLYVNKATDKIEFDKECRQLLKNIYTFDVLRSDKCISSHGLEPRTPFLDREWVQYYLSIHIDLRAKTIDEPNLQEKWLLRTAFNETNYKTSTGNALLPESVLYRRKEAFSDGVSQQTRSLNEIVDEYAKKYIQENILSKINFIVLNNDYKQLCYILPQMDKAKKHLIPKTAEQFLYRYLFEKSYRGLGHVLPYFWMPKYIDCDDPSARTLTIYNTTNP